MNRKTQYLLQSLSAGKFYMSRSVADAFLFSLIETLKNPDLKGFLDDSETPEQKEQAALRFIASYSQDAQPYIADKWYRYPPFVVQGVLVIPVNGVITQDSYWGETSTKNIMSWYEKAKNDPEIVGVLEVGNSPGGAVFGTRELATYKASYPKPKVTLVEGLCASAYMYISAPADKILATSASAILGSIGVMTTYASFKKYYESMGIDVKDVYSIGSPQKNYAYREAEKGNFKPLEEGVLFQLDNQFTNFVKAYRPGLSKRATLGADMTAEDAMKEGLLDDIATFDEAIQLVKSLANSYQPKAAKSNTKMSKQYVIITSNKTLLRSARTLQTFNASNISIEEVEIEEDENDDNGNPPTNQPEGAGASASNQQEPTGQPAASNAAPTPPSAPANAQPDASAQSPEEKIAAAIAIALAPLQAEIKGLKAHANLQINSSTPPIQNNQQLTATGQSDDELFTAVQQ